MVDVSFAVGGIRVGGTSVAADVLVGNAVRSAAGFETVLVVSEKLCGSVASETVEINGCGEVEQPITTASSKARNEILELDMVHPPCGYANSARA